MGNILGGSEIVGIGIQIEVNGRDFYNAIAKKTQDQDACDLFKFLAAEEEKHITAFEKLHELVKKYDESESFPGEGLDYINEMVSSNIFTKKDAGVEIADGVSSDIEALDLGIRFEKDSIEFYEGVKKVVREPDSKVVDSLIKQEQEHLRKLTEIKENL